MATFVWGFNPRAREARDTQPMNQTANPTRFNPRAREARDYLVPQLIPIIIVSIHARVKRATVRLAQLIV